MDPTANLREQLALAKSILAFGDSDSEDYVAIADDAARLAELVESLDSWIRRGGFSPQQWQKIPAIEGRLSSGAIRKV